MHLASCLSKKKLPVPSALPECLAARLPSGDEAKESAAAVAGGATKGGKPNQKLEKASAVSPSGGHSESDPIQRSTNAGGTQHGERARTKRVGEKAGEKNSETVGNEAGVKAGGTGGGKGGNKRGAHKAGTAREAERAGESGLLGKAGHKGGDKTGGAATAEKVTGPSKKRGFGMFSSSAGTAEANKPSAAEQQAAASKSASLADASGGGGKKKKKTKKTGSGDEQKTKQDGKQVAVATEKRKSLSADQKAAETGSKPIIAKSKKSGTKEASNATAAAAAVGGRVATGTDSAERLAHEREREGQGAGENGSSIAEHQLAVVRDVDGDDDDAGAETGDTPEKKAQKRKPLSSEERDQLYAMTTSERAGYDVVFMQVLAR